MDLHTGHVMNLANSIIGVSILAMPYCFQQCGIILSILLLVFTNILSRLTCHFLLKSALLVRRKNFEYLAFYVFGSVGKFFIEVGIIGFLLGTCIAFFVVMGDLGPQIIGEITGTNTTDTMRTSILMALALFCVLPLGLLRNVDSLNGVSKATIGFYVCLMLKIILVALPHLFSKDWLAKVELWKFDGILQCIPIFAMALSCQTQLFEIYQVIPNASLEKMNRIVGIAVNICTCVYICVGLFGYIAFSSKPFTGNILLSFIPTASNSAIKIGFIFSLAFSFPLVIFPCRASLYSLLYKGSYTVHDGVGNYMPEGRFKSLTLIIVLTSLVIGIMIPNIEVVLGLVGSTIGVMICVMFPVTSFICISQKNTSERVVAQVILFLGIIIMVLSTYANLYAADKVIVNPITIGSEIKGDTRNKFENVLKEPNIELKQINANLVEKDSAFKSPATENMRVGEGIKKVKKKYLKNSSDTKPVEDNKDKNQLPINDEVKQVEQSQAAVVKEIRHEPPQPVEPVEAAEQPNAADQAHDQVSSKPNEAIQHKAEQVVEVIKMDHLSEKKEVPNVKNIESQIKPMANNVIENTNNNQKERLDESIIETRDKKLTGDNKENLDENIIIEKVHKLEKTIDDNIHKIEQLAKSNNLLPNLQAESGRLDDELIPDKKASPLKKLVPDGLDSQHLQDTNNVIVDGKSDKKNDEVDIEAIKKEETELKEQEKERVKVKEDKEKVLIETIQKQNEVQKELVEQQKKLLKVMEKKEKENDVIDKEKVEAVRRIETAARKAIESIGGKDEKPKPVDIHQMKADENKLIDNLQNSPHNNENSKLDDKPIVDAAPLSYQLGLNNVNLSINGNSSDMKENNMPLPLALVMSQKAQSIKNAAQNLTFDEGYRKLQEKLEQNKSQQFDMKHKKLESDVGKDDLNKPGSESIHKKEEMVSVKKENQIDAVNAIRRDILSHELERIKRDVTQSKGLNNIEPIQMLGETEHVIDSDENKICQDKKGEHPDDVYGIISSTDHNSEKETKHVSQSKIEPSKNMKPTTVNDDLDNAKKSSKFKRNDELYGKLKISQMLSDPKLVSPDLSLLNVESLIPIKPQSRDLKQAEQNDD